MEDKKKKRLFWQIPFLLFLVAGTIFIVRQQRSMPYQKDSGFIFGTVYNVTYQSGKNLQQEIEEEMQKVDDALSMFNSRSVISKVNQGECVIEDSEVGDMFVEVFKLARRISDDTDGAFDITVAPLVNAWGFGFKNGSMPSQHQIDSLRQFVGYQSVQYQEKKGIRSVVKADSRTMLDCSAIAKGYGTDMVARLLKKRGVENFMVEIGGEVVTCGVSPNRVPWRIGVTKPVDDTLAVDGEVLTVLNVTDRAMATSGNYRNFYYKDGRKYAHTIDPQTGAPVQHSLLSATVLATDCAVADAYATSFMVMGLEKAKAVLERHKNLMAYFIYTGADGQLETWYSSSLQDKISK